MKSLDFISCIQITLGAADISATQVIPFAAISADQHIGEKLVLDCLAMAKEKVFRIMQFNAVVASNTHALHLYEHIWFTKLGVIPGGFRMPDGHYEDIIPHYYVL